MACDGQGVSTFTLGKNCLGEIIFFLQILKFILRNIVQLLGQLKVYS